MRWSASRSLCTAGALLTVGVSNGCAASADPPVTADRSQGTVIGTAVAGHALPVPGTDPAIQRWLLNNDAAKIKFNNALLQAQRGVATGKAAECKPLDTAARALLAAIPALHRLSLAGQKLAATIQAPMTTFASAAAACLTEDFAAAHTALDAGVVQQADAQEAIDEILEGEL